jgi:flagellar motility protein MotE (MotC chaperone)
MLRGAISHTLFFLILCWLSFGYAISAVPQDINLPQEEGEITEVLAKQKRALSIKEEAIKAKEVQLKMIEQDISEKIQELKKLKEDLAKSINRQNLEGPKGEKELARLAKVYEAAPPEQAAQLLEKLDIKLAAKILMQINPRKAGKIWGYVNPVQGAKISTELGKEINQYGEPRGTGN